MHKEQAQATNQTANQHTIQREYLSKMDLSHYLGGVGVRTINNWMQSRNFPYIRIGTKFVRFKKSEVDRWMQQNSDARSSDDALIDQVVNEILG